MLVDQHDAYVFPLCGEPLEGGLDCRIVRLVVHDQEVLLRVWWSRDMLVVIVSADKMIKHMYGRTPMPASSRPVTESYVVCQSRGAKRLVPNRLCPTSSPITARNCRSL